MSDTDEMDSSIPFQLKCNILKMTSSLLESNLLTLVFLVIFYIFTVDKEHL